MAASNVLAIASLPCSWKAATVCPPMAGGHPVRANATITKDHRCAAVSECGLTRAKALR